MKKEKMELGKQKKKNFLILTLLAAISSSLTGCSNAKIETKNITIELGQEVPDDPKDYVSASKESAYEDITIDVSAVNQEKAGTYAIPITYKKEQYTAELSIADTTVPEIAPVSYVAIQPGNEIKASDLLGEVQDLADCKTYIVSSEKEAELQDINITPEEMKELTPEVSTEANLNTTNLQEAMTLKEEGCYLVSAAGVDESGNASIAKIYVYVDGTAPEITPAPENQTISIAEFKTEDKSVTEVMNQIHEVADIKTEYSWKDTMGINDESTKITMETLEVKVKDDTLQESLKVNYALSDTLGNEGTAESTITVTYTGIDAKALGKQIGIYSEPAPKPSHEESSNKSQSTESNNTNNSQDSSANEQKASDSSMAENSSSSETSESSNTNTAENSSNSSKESNTFEEGYRVDMANELLNLINQERVANGLNQLSWSDSLAKLANERVLEITTNFSHKRTDGTSVSNYNLETGTYYTDGTIWIGEHGSLGENIGHGLIDAKGMHDGFMNSKGHRGAILREVRTHCAIAVYQNSEGFWYVEVFN